LSILGYRIRSEGDTEVLSSGRHTSFRDGYGLDARWISRETVGEFSGGYFVHGRYDRATHCGGFCELFRDGLVVAAATWKILGRNDAEDDDSYKRTAPGSWAVTTVVFTTRLNGASNGPGRYETCAASRNGRPGSHPDLFYGGIGSCRGGVLAAVVGCCSRSNDPD